LYAAGRFCDWLSAQGLSLGDARQTTVARYLDQLGRCPSGERPHIAQGLHHCRAVLYVPDRGLGTQNLGFEGCATLGILLRAKVEGRIPRIDSLLAHLDHLGFRLSAKTHAAVLKQAGE
jgi:predicted nucleic acid-binding protein